MGNKMTHEEAGQVLEDAGVAYDPGHTPMDLTKEEKRRTTALMMAIQAYQHLIIKDAEMYRAVSDEARNREGPEIKPATMDAIVVAAMQFDLFISGKLSNAIAPTPPAIAKGKVKAKKKKA